MTDEQLDQPLPTVIELLPWRESNKTLRQLLENIIFTKEVWTAALSGANAKLYVSSRLLFSMGRTGWAPASVGKLNAAGSPRVALLISSYGIVTALVIEYWAPKNAFIYIMGAAFSGLIFSWAASLAAHISFRRQIQEHRPQRRTPARPRICEFRAAVKHRTSTRDLSPVPGRARPLPWPSQPTPTAS